MALPAAVAADWLTTIWDQNAGLYVAGPSAAVVEEVAGAWLADLLGLPDGVAVAFVTGCQMAHVTALARTRHHVLAREGWDVNADGLQGAPRLRVVAGEERHTTLDRALRFIGIGGSQIQLADADGEGRMDPEALRRVLRDGDGRRSSAPRPATSTPARSTRSRRSPTRRTRPAPGSTSTAPSGCGRTRARASATSSPGSTGPTRGPPTRTSG